MFGAQVVELSFPMQFHMQFGTALWGRKLCVGTLKSRLEGIRETNAGGSAARSWVTSRETKCSFVFGAPVLDKTRAGRLKLGA